jgi:chaperone required for assembly of F1-ATPase
MRELFEEAAGRAPLDPNESARQSARSPQRKRFYEAASFDQTADGFAIKLDGKPVRTPARDLLVVPNQTIAQAIVDEWNAQQDVIDPLSMPMTRLANSVISAVTNRVEAVAEDLAKYFESDLLFYRAAHPEALIAREAEHWDPVLFWVADAFGARFMLAESIVHVRQPEHAVAAVRAALPTDPWSVAAAHVATTVTGSALLALALIHGARDVDQAWAAANVDEDWNIEQWGLDSEAAARRAGRLADLRAAALVLDAMRGTAG